MGEFTTGVLGYSVTGPTFTYIALADQDLPTNAEVTGSSAGQLYKNQLSLTRFDPVLSFSTSSIGAILDLIALNGTCVGSGFTVLTALAIARKLGTCDDPLGATPHMLHACTKGLFRLGSLRASRDQDASISGTLDMFTTGGANPVTVTDGVAWPSTIVETRYRLGLCKISAVQFPEVEDITLDFQVEITPKSPQLGSIWTTTAGVIMVNPVLTLRGRDLTRVKTGLIELSGNAATSVNTLIQLQKLVDGASFEADGSSVHTTLLVTGLTVPTNLQNASAGSRATNEIVLTCKSISGVAPVVIDTTAVYTPSP